MDGLQCKGEFPPIVADDHAQWNIDVQYTYPNPVEGGDPLPGSQNFNVASTKASPTPDCLFVVHKESTGTVKLAAVDKKGNKSEFGNPVPFTATDSFPPPIPGGLNISVVGEAELPVQ